MSDDPTAAPGDVERDAEIGDETDEELDDESGAAAVEAGPEPVDPVEDDGDGDHHEATLGPAALQVLISRLTGIAEEMGAVLRRAAFSPNIKERADCSAALFDAGGELLVQAEHIPVHLGSMPAAVAAAIDAFGDEIEPGEQIVLNDPFAGGTHLNDITVVAPCHVDGEIVGWVANRAHHADLGGATPGSIPPEATEIQQEGLRLPPVRLNADLREVIVASSRTPDERRGDLDAQWGANVVGLTGLEAEAGRPLDQVAAYGERRMRAALADLPDGRWDFTDVLDSTGPRPNQQAAATICVGGDHRRRRDHLRLHRHRRPAVGEHERGRGGHAQCGRLCPAVGGGPRPRGRGRLDATGQRDRAGGDDRRRTAAGRRRCGQRRGQPAHRRRLSGGVGPGRARPGGGGVAGDDEQRPHRRRRLGLLRDRRRRAGRPTRTGTA